MIESVIAGDVAPSAASSRFGPHLVDRIEERDIDLMLLEEHSLRMNVEGAKLASASHERASAIR